MLRGINLGKRTLVKTDLLGAAEDAGFSEARTLLASGNLVFEAGDRKAEAIEQALHEAVKARTGISSDVFLRNRKQLEAVLRDNPFPEVAKERPSYLLVSFAREEVPADLPRRVAEAYDGPERLAVVGRELYIDYPGGQGESKLGPAMAKLKIKILMTGRNWNTVQKLADML
jgi:uncharacterized protein (DUF1697 family)